MGRSYRTTTWPSTRPTSRSLTNNGGYCRSVRGRAVRLLYSSTAASSSSVAAAGRRTTTHRQRSSRIALRHANCRLYAAMLPVITTTTLSTTRECVHLVTRRHFRSRDKDGGCSIRSDIAEKCENPMLHGTRKPHSSMFYRSEVMAD